MSRDTVIGVCISCGDEKAIAARGLCRACYSRWRENGTTAYVRDFKDRTCKVDGCGLRAHGQGLCTKHLQRLRRTGTTDEGRKYTIKQKKPEDMRSLHDLYPIWREFNRPSSPRPVHDLWRDDFDSFVAAVGDRPNKRARLFPRDRSKVLGPDNFEWREGLVVKQPGETDQEYNARHRLARREIMGTGMWDSDLRKKYGADFGAHRIREMLEQQGHRCAISGEKETATLHGVTRGFATDHDHRTGAVRQLLTGACNTALGLFKDDISLMAKAILYLAKHDPDGQGQAKVDAAIAYLQRYPVAGLDKTAIIPQT